MVSCETNSVGLSSEIVLPYENLFPSSVLGLSAAVHLAAISAKDIDENRTTQIVKTTNSFQWFRTIANILLSNSSLELGSPRYYAPLWSKFHQLREEACLCLG